VIELRHGLKSFKRDARKRGELLAGAGDEQRLSA